MPDSSLRIYDERVAQPSRPTRSVPTSVVAARPIREEMAPTASPSTGERATGSTGATAGASTPNVAKLKLVATPATDDLEARMLAILGSSARAGETIDAAFGRKEHELGELFARLSVMDSRALHWRLSAARSDDHLATQFGRLVAVRRARLLAFLADVRRREAIALAHKC